MKTNHNQYVSTPNWFSSVKEEVKQTKPVIQQNVYYGSGSNSNNNGISSLSIYNKAVYKEDTLQLSDLSIMGYAVIAIQKEEENNAGELTVNDAWSSSLFIPVVGGSEITINTSYDSTFTYGIAFYDVQKKYISGNHTVQELIQTVIVPTNAVYFRICALSVYEEFNVKYQGLSNYSYKQLTNIYGKGLDPFTSIDDSFEYLYSSTFTLDKISFVADYPLKLEIDSDNNIHFNINDLLLSGVFVNTSEEEQDIDGIKIFKNGLGIGDFLLIPDKTNNSIKLIHKNELIEKESNTYFGNMYVTGWFSALGMSPGGIGPSFGGSNNLFELNDVSTVYNEQGIPYAVLGTTGENTVGKVLTWDGSKWYADEVLNSIKGDERYLLKKIFSKIFTAYNEKGEIIDITDYNSIIDNVSINYSLWSTGFISAYGMSKGDPNPTALYQLTDVLSENNEVQGAAIGSVLTYNGTHWYASKLDIDSSIDTDDILDILDQYDYLTKDEADDAYLLKQVFKNIFTAYDADDNEVDICDISANINNIKINYGFWSNSFISALGKQLTEPSSTTALYQLVDVLANETNTGVKYAKKGSVLTFDGTHWIAGVVNTNGGIIDEAAIMKIIERYNYLDQTAGDKRYLLNDLFLKIFTAYDEQGNKVDLSSDVIDNIKVNYNFWSDGYLSSRGISDDIINAIDFIEVDEKTISKQNGYLEVIGGVGNGITDAYTKAEVDALLSKKWTQNDIQITNWNTAFEWGNHASAGYFLAANFTKANIKNTLGISDWALASVKPTYKTSEVAEETNLYFTNQRAINALADTLAKYVTLSGTQTITGEKDFTGGLKVNGSAIVYDKTNKYWKLTGDLLVTGGITMYANDGSYTPSTITDMVNIDNVTIIRQNGKLMVNPELTIGGGGGGEVTTVAWGSVVGKPTWITETKPEYKFTELKDRPTNIEGYGITDAKISNGTITLGGNSITPLTQSSGDARYVTLLGVSGNNLTWVKNGKKESLTIPYATKAKELSTWKVITITKTNDAGMVYKLIANLTNWKKGYDGQWGMIGVMYGHRGGNMSGTCVQNIVAYCASWSSGGGGTGYEIKTDVRSYVRPVIVTYNGVNYLAFRMSGSGSAREHVFMGYTENLLDDFVEVLESDANVSLLYDTELTLMSGVHAKQATNDGDGKEISSTYLKLEGGTLTGGLVSQAIYPSATNTYALGTSSSLWSNLFTKKATIDGIELKKSTSDVLYIDANLVVRGGITMYGTDGTTATTIWDGAPKATTNNNQNGKGIASFDSKFFSVNNGHVTFIGSTGGGGLDENALANYLSTNKYLTETAGNSLYLGIKAKAASASTADSATNATNASNVYLNSASSNSTYRLVLANNASGGNRSLYVDSESTATAGYNPSTNTFVGNGFSGNSVTLGNGVSAAINTKGWYRFATTINAENVAGGSLIFSIRRHYNTSKTESHTIVASLGYGAVTFTEIAGAPSDALITKVRATNNKDGVVYFDFYYGADTSNSHNVYVNCIGSATLQTPTATTQVLGYLTEFDLVNGFKSNVIHFTSLNNLAYMRQKCGKNLLVDGDNLSGGTAYGFAGYNYDSAVTVGRTYRLTICGKLGENTSHIYAYWDGGGGNNTYIGGLSKTEERIVTIRAKITNKGSNNRLIFYKFNSSNTQETTSYAYIRWAYLEEVFQEDDFRTGTTITTAEKTAYNNWLAEYNMRDTKAFLHKVYRIDLDGLIKITRTDSTGDAFITCARTDTSKSIAFGVGVGGVNRGIWDNTFSKWLFYADADKTWLTQNTWISQDTWNGGLILNRKSSNGGAGCGISVWAENTSNNTRTELGQFGIAGNGRFEFDTGSGNTRFYVDTSGNGLFYGGITMYSDERKKTILNHVELTLKQVADAPIIEHYYNSDEKKTTHVGSIAQYWAGLNDWFCKEDGDGFYTMEIQNAALASAISVARELMRYESKTDKQIRLLKKRICELEDEIETLKGE